MPSTPPTYTALILAGGLGTRLRSVVSVPKVLAPVLGRPFLTHLLDQLESQGASRVILATGYQADLVESTLGKSYRSLSLIYSRETTPLGTAGAIRLALPLLSEHPTLVLNGDSFSSASFIEGLRFHREVNAQASILLQKVEDARRYGRVQTNPQGAVIAFEEKTSKEEPAWVNAGIYFLNRPMIESIPAGQPLSIERDIFPQWIGKGLYAYQASGQFHDIGTPESYPKTEAFLKSLSSV